MNIAVLIKTFLREEPIFKCIESVKKQLPGARIYIGDDSETISERKRQLYDQLISEGHKVLELPFNSGLSYGRNELVKIVEEPYILLIDDDFILTEDINAEKAIQALEKTPEMGILAGMLFNGEREWHYEHNLDIKNGAIYKTTVPKKWVKIAGLEMIPSDLVLNFFFCKKQTLVDNPWDNDYKISLEHMDFFLRLKETKWKAYYSPEIKSIHAPERTEEYSKFRSQKGHWARFAAKWNVDRIYEEDGLVYLYLEERVVPNRGRIFRDDDVSLDSDIKQLREVRDIFEKYGLRETYSVVPFGKTQYLNQHFNWDVPLETLDEWTGFEPITNNQEVVDFIKESLERGHQIILHGHTHTRIAEYDLKEVFDKLLLGKRLLEHEFGVKIQYYASPFNQKNDKIEKVCKTLGLELLDGSGDQLEKCVKEGLPLKENFCWYHNWRFYQGGLTVEMLDRYLNRLNDWK